MKIWQDEEVKNLFKSVEKAKRENVALKNAFDEHAKNYHRKSDSVRNYYYQEVENLKNDKKRCEKLQINLLSHQKVHFQVFEKKQEETLLSQIEELVKSGMSVRSACLKLSNGSLTLMTRYQNKYQNLKKKTKLKDNIIPFRQTTKTLSESDINSLFLGLVKLIKKTAVEDVLQRSRLQQQSTEKLLQKAFEDLNKKDRQLLQLQADFNQLKKENIKLQANFLDKKQALKRHLEKKKLQRTIEN